MPRSEAINVQYRTTINEINDKVQVIVRKYRPDKIILFGSHAQGKTSPDSDVDLLVIIDTEQATWDLAVEISLALKHSFPMDIIVRTPQEIARRLKYGDFFIKNIIEQGKVLYERVR